MNLKAKLDLKKNNQLSYCQSYPWAYKKFKEYINELFLGASDSLLKKGCQVLIVYSDVTLNYINRKEITFELAPMENYNFIRFKCKELDITDLITENLNGSNMLEEWVEAFKAEEGMETKKFNPNAFAVIYKAES